MRPTSVTDLLLLRLVSVVWELLVGEGGVRVDETVSCGNGELLWKLAESDKRSAVVVAVGGWIISSFFGSPVTFWTSTCSTIPAGCSRY